MRNRWATNMPRGVRKPLRTSSGIWSVALPWPGSLLPSIQFEMPRTLWISISCQSMGVDDEKAV